MGLGDLIEKALSTVGVSKERVEKWVGAPCGCKERQEKLNQLGFWAMRTLKGFTSRALEYLTLTIGDSDELHSRNGDDPS